MYKLSASHIKSNFLKEDFRVLREASPYALIKKNNLSMMHRIQAMYVHLTIKLTLLKKTREAIPCA